MNVPKIAAAASAISLALTPACQTTSPRRSDEIAQIQREEGPFADIRKDCVRVLVEIRRDLETASLVLDKVVDINNSDGDCGVATDSAIRAFYGNQLAGAFCLFPDPEIIAMRESLRGSQKRVEAGLEEKCND